jgi:penicillin-binding protein 1A
MFAVDLPDTSKLYRRQAPALDLLSRPLGRPDRGARQPVRAACRSRPPAQVRARAAFIAIEDRWYYYHFGFNPWGIVRSQLYNLKRESGPLRGGSTITQQLARNLFLTLRTRTIAARRRN